MNFVQSFITNISFPTSLEELYKYVHLFDIEKVLGCSYSDFIDDYDKYNDSTYESRGVCWTAPKWCKKGDIVFFMHSKTANAKIRKLRKELLNKRESLSSNYFWTMMNALIRADKLHNTYGGKIFAKGLPPKNARSVVCISGCTLNRRPAVIGLMESYRIYTISNQPMNYTPSALFIAKRERKHSHERKV